MVWCGFIMILIYSSCRLTHHLCKGMLTDLFVRNSGSQRACHSCLQRNSSPSKQQHCPRWLRLAHVSMSKATAKFALPSLSCRVFCFMLQPRNYDFGMFRFNLLGPQGGNSREMTTSSRGHHWEATLTLTTAAKLQQFRANSREMHNSLQTTTILSQQPWNDESKTQQSLPQSMTFCVASWLLSFQVSLGIL